jgi:AhpD family alkylhydroperoxidase
MRTRLEMNQYFPESYKLMAELDKHITASGIPPLYIDLIKIRASQINGCAFCLDKHIGEAIRQGEDPRRIYVLDGWKEAPDWFSEEEQAILLLTEEISLIGQHGVSNEVYDKALELFGASKLAFLIMAAVSINAWNRIGIALSMHPKK